MISKDQLEYRAMPLPDHEAPNDEELAKRAMAFLQSMKSRCSVRQFSSRPVDRQVILDCIAVATSAPSGANHQPWHFVAVGNPQVKAQIRAAAEAQEEKFYGGNAGDEWLKALEPIGTGPEKPHLEHAPWLIVVFAQRYGEFADGTRYKNYYVNESVGIAAGFLLAAIHQAGLVALTHTPNPMTFLNALLGRPSSEKPVLIIPVGHPAQGATVPAAARIKKPLEDVLTVI